VLRESGVSSALASLGGNVVAYGAKPDGSAWNVAVQDPDARLDLSASSR
jgi:thiamine biosynthesis lipoprotein